MSTAEGVPDNPTREDPLGDDGPQAPPAQGYNVQRTKNSRTSQTLGKDPRRVFDWRRKLAEENLLDLTGAELAVEGTAYLVSDPCAAGVLA